MWQSPQQANTVVLMDRVVSKPKECVQSKLSKSKNDRVISMATGMTEHNPSKMQQFAAVAVAIKKVHCKVLTCALNKVITQDL